MLSNELILIKYAGGVAMGTASNMDVTPAGALAIGFAAGVLSTVGYAYVKVSFQSFSH